MNDIAEEINIELIYVIVNHGFGSRIVKAAKRDRIKGSTIAYARGTAHKKFLDYLGLSDIRKEIVFLLADKETAFRAMEDLNRDFCFDKPNHGIAFTTSVCKVSGTKNIVCNKKSERGAESVMFNLITIIVDKGKGEEVVAAAEKSGSRGATILNARGSGIHETAKLFSMEIAPEKEIVLILSECGITDEIVNSISSSLKMNEPGNGIIYVQNVNTAYGVR